MPAPVEPAPSANSNNPQIAQSIGSSTGGPAEDVSSSQIRTEPPHAPGRSMIRLLVAAAVSTLLASVLVEYFGSPFRIPESVMAGIGVAPTPEQSAKVGAAKRVRAGRNSCVTFALIGAVLGLSFGSALGVGQGSRRVYVAGCTGGVLCGAASGAIAAIVVPEFFRALEAEHKTILAEACAWAVIGVGVGLGVSLALHSRRALAHVALGALAGGLVGGALYFPVVALLIPAVDTDLLIPDSFVAKLVWIALPAIGMAVGMGRALFQIGPAPVGLDGQRNGSRPDAPTPVR